MRISVPHTQAPDGVENQSARQVPEPQSGKSITPGNANLSEKPYPDEGISDEEKARKQARKKRRRRRQKISSFLTTIGVIIGLVLLAYPWVADWYSNYLALEQIDSYSASVSFMSDEEKDYMFAEAEAYNRMLAGDTSQYDKHPEYSHDYWSLLDYNHSGIIGTVEIPVSGIMQPIYRGTDEAVLMSGAGHLEKTSIPIGGSDTHAMIAGHTGMPGQRMFDRLSSAKPGDIVKVTIIDRNFYYQVTSSKVVTPDYADFSIRPGESILTLVTCTPYGVNDHRLLVECHQIDYTEEQYEEIEALDPIENYLNLRTIPFIVAFFLTLVVSIWLAIWSRKKKRERQRRKELRKAGEKNASSEMTSNATPELPEGGDVEHAKGR